MDKTYLDVGFFLHLNQLTCVLTCAYPIARVFRQGSTSLVTITVVFVNSDAFESLWFWTCNFCHWWILFCGNGVLVFHVSLYRLHAVSIWCLNRFLYYRFSLIFSKASLFLIKLSTVPFNHYVSLCHKATSGHTTSFPNSIKNKNVQTILRAFDIEDVVAVNHFFNKLLELFLNICCM